MNRRVKNSLIAIAVVFLIVLGQFWLTDFNGLNLSNIRLLGVMLASVVLLTWATKFKQDKDMRIVVAYQVIIVTLLTLTIRLLYDIGSGNMDFLSSVAVPICYGMIVYLIYLMFHQQIKFTKDREVTYHEKFIEMGLTPRECSIAAELMKGKTNKEIGSSLYIAESTVKKHVQNILKKVDCDNRQAFCEWVIFKCQ